MDKKGDVPLLSVHRTRVFKSWTRRILDGLIEQRGALAADGGWGEIHQRNGKKLEAKKTVILAGESPPFDARLVGRNYHSISF